MGFLPWEIRVAFPGESQLRQSRATQPRAHAGCFSGSIIHRTLTWDHGIFNVRTEKNSTTTNQNNRLMNNYMGAIYIKL